MNKRCQRIVLRHDDGYPSGFTIVDNRDIWTTCDRDRKLLLRPLVLGVYTAMRSLPGGWEFREPWLMKHLGMGRDSLRGAIRDLESASRLTRTVQRDAQGRYVRTIWALLRAGASPLTGSPSMVNPSPEVPAAGKLHRRESRARLNTEGASSTDPITTTTTPALVWPHGLDANKRVVVELMEGLSPALHQSLLDEFAGKMERDPPRSPMGWFVKTITRARTGEDGGFVPSLGVAVAARRARRAQEAADEGVARAAATGAQGRRNEAQALLDQMDDAQVRALLAAVPGVEPGQIDEWLQDGRSAERFIAAMARAEIAKTGCA